MSIWVCTVQQAALPGLPASMGAPHMLDVACIHAAACNVAIADTAFRAAVKPPTSLGVMASLSGICQRAETGFPSSPEATGLIALMDFQFGRLTALKVRGTPSCRGFAPAAAALLAGCSRHARPSLQAEEIVQQLC